MLNRPLHWIFVLLFARAWMPRRLQIMLRRRLARREEARCGARWPILEQAGTPPPEWNGWPQGHRFAFVLTHDVDTRRGLDRCRALMDIEEQLGFRSAFFFVPRGRYDVPPGLIDEMKRRGFEVGVHGLYHDWWTFLSRRVFRRRAPLIRSYLSAWGSVGFRAPSTIRNPSWIRELGVDYDTSTFDTDPFEPQPAGAATVFPRWVAEGGDGTGHIELPYTLPQDFTLFVLLQHRDAAVWQRKLAWIAERGGMALMDVHPDYACPDEGSVGFEEYPMERYRAFLNHVRARYAGAYWSALPRDVARFARASLRPPTPAVARPSLAGRRALMIVFSVYPGDPRVRRAGEALAEAGLRTDVICLGEPGRPSRECCGGVQVYRVPVRRKRTGKFRYLFEYAAFGLAALGRAAWLHVRHPYALVHVHNMPDALVFSALVPRMTGAKVILDLHDPMPEVYRTKYGAGEDHRLIRALRWMEQRSLRFAHLGLTPNLAFRDLFVRRSCAQERMRIVMNSPQERLFQMDGNRVRVRAAAPQEPWTLMYHGTIVERHGLDLAVEAVARLRAVWPGLRFEVYGEGDSFVQAFRRLIAERGVGDVVFEHGPRPLEEIARRIRAVDAGVIPNRRSVFTEINLPTRIFEYLAVGKPVVAPRTRGILDYFDEESLFLFEPGDAESLAAAIRRVHDDPPAAERIVERGRRVYERHTWQAEKKAYLDAVEELCGRAPRSRAVRWAQAADAPVGRPP